MTLKKSLALAALLAMALAPAHAFAGGACCKTGAKASAAGSRAGKEAAGCAGMAEMCKPHGGMCARTESHCFETVYAPEGVRVYVYATENHVPVMLEKARGTATLTLKDGTTREVPLTVEKAQTGDKTIYFCPRHTDAAQLEPGTCTKCGGMELMAQNHFAGKTDLFRDASGSVKVAFQLQGITPDGSVASFASEYGQPAGASNKDAQASTGGARAGGSM